MEKTATERCQRTYPDPVIAMIVGDGEEEEEEEF